MSKTLQFRRGTTSELSAIAGAIGELFVDTTKDTVVVMDGSTAGGFPLASEALLTSVQSSLQSSINAKVDSSSLATVATSGSYNDLTDKPTIPSLTGYATESYVTTQISNVIGAAPAALDTLNELAAALGNDANYASTITTALSGKQATLVSGTNIKTVGGTSLLGSGNIALFSGSYNDLTNKPTLFSGAYADLTGKPSIPTTTSALTNDSGFITTAALSTYATQSYVNTQVSSKQNTLVSGSNIKSINGQSILGSGNLVISGGTSGGSLDFGTFTSPAGFTLDMGIF